MTTPNIEQLPNAGKGRQPTDGEARRPARRLDNRLAYKTTELTQVLPFGKTKIFELIADGTLESVKVGKSRLVTAESVRRLIEGEAA